MKIARISGTVTATVKISQLSGLVLLLADLVDAAGNVLEPAVVLADSLGAGPGDLVLVSQGSAARVAPAIAGLAIDASSVAIIDSIHCAAGAKTSPATSAAAVNKSSTRKSAKG